jgi:hypothetical protein
MEYAQALFGRPRIIVVWDGKPGDGSGGTADAVGRWQVGGFDQELDVIEPARL